MPGISRISARRMFIFSPEFQSFIAYHITKLASGKGILAKENGMWYSGEKEIDVCRAVERSKKERVIARQCAHCRGTEGNACGAISFEFRKYSANLMGIATPVTSVTGSR